jgi:hypothetical protein
MPGKEMPMPPAALRGPRGGSPWTPYMLRSSVVSVFIRLLMKARENPFRFEMLHRSPRESHDRE